MKDIFTKKWIIENALNIISGYEKRILTIRGLHYRLVAIGMTNDQNHYKRVVDAMSDARWNGLIDFDTFSDHDRFMLGETKYQDFSLEDKVDEAEQLIKALMTNYSLNKWQGQEYYVEVLIEKKALQGLFQGVCDYWNVALGACKGYPSLTFLYDASIRFKEALNKGFQPVILYFGDYDPSGEDIPRSLKENIIRLGCRDIEINRVALTEKQVIEMNLPPAPVKKGDRRSATWTGLGQVELDAVEPNILQWLCYNAISELFDESIERELRAREDIEKTEFRAKLKSYVSTL